MIYLRGRWVVFGVLLGSAAYAETSDSATSAAVEREARAVAPQAIAWRRDIHEHPELGYQETRTAALVAQHLRSLGIEAISGVAHTGVIGILHGTSPGPTVALRTELDALPVTEAVDLPFSSKVRVSYHGQDTRRNACLRPRRSYCNSPGYGDRTEPVASPTSWDRRFYLSAERRADG